MPIHPDNRALYPPNWKEVVERIRQRSGGRCECLGECGRDHAADEWDTPGGLWIGQSRCVERNRDPAWSFRGVVILTVAHLDHQPPNVDDANLRDFCQRCHLRYDRAEHQRSRRARLEKASGQRRLF